MHRNQRRHHPDCSFFGARFHNFIERPIILRPAIGIAGTVRLNRSDVDFFGSQHFRPTDGDGEKMRIAKRDIGDGNAGPAMPEGESLAMRFGNGNARIGEGGSADGAQSFIAHQQPVANFQPVADAFEGAPFALFGALPVADMDGGRMVVACRKRRTNAGIHAAAQQDDGARLAGGRIRRHHVSRRSCL